MKSSDMIRIKPTVEASTNCPYCNNVLAPVSVIWQGIHVCAKSYCAACKIEVIADLPVGHSLFAPCVVDVNTQRLFLEDKNSLSWFGKPFLHSLVNPSDSNDISLKVEHFFETKSVVILNCIDYLYGHALLKLLNISSLLNMLKTMSGCGAIVVIQPFLRWMVPDGVCEIWTVNIPLKKAQNYYPLLNEQIACECQRFDDIFVSKAHSHPKEFDIQTFTGIGKHDLSSSKYRITFVWREDRLWHSDRIPIRIARIKPVNRVLLHHQNSKVLRFFSYLKRHLPEARYTIAGLGRHTRFPSWIDDQRISSFNAATEKDSCRIYSESRLVVGIHGSNMLLPSGHAGMTIDLMPQDRWGNLAQDILYHERDARIATFRYRFLPIHTKSSLLATIAVKQINDLPWFKKAMVDNLI